MSVAAVKEYIGVPRDVEANFNGLRLIYVTWDHHLLFAAPFCCPVPPGTKFEDFTKVIAGIIAPHPDAAKVDWSKVEWFKSYQPWKPDFNKTIAENGITHKEFLRFRTPGLNGLGGKGF